MRSKKPLRFGNVITHVILITFGLLMIYPVLWMLFGSFKPNQDIFTSASFFPTHWTLNNYIQGWSLLPDMHFGNFIKNSFIISASVVVGTVLSSSLVAFAFARFEFRFKRILFSIMMVTLMLPSQITLIPQYTMYHFLGLINTYVPLIAPAFFGAPFFIFLLIQFMRGLPKELDEAAKIDGCNSFQIYWRIIMPLSVPALMTTAIFSFIWSWDDFFSQLVYINSSSMFTAPLGLKLFMDESGAQLWGSMFAMSMLSLIPLFLVFMFFQKYIVKGIATSGLKG